jgi:hypothetical protein
MDVVLRCASLQDLKSFVGGHGQGGVWMLPQVEGDAQPAQFARLRLHLIFPDATGALEVEVLQVMPGAGLVVRLLEPDLIDDLLDGVEPAAAPTAPRLSWIDEAAGQALHTAEPTATDGAAATSSEQAQPGDEGASAQGSAATAVTGPAAWPIERLLAEWGNLGIPDRILVAKRGQLAARRHVIKQQDRTLHGFVLANPGVTAEEVAAMAGMATLDPELLKRIASKAEWLRHGSVVRNLICNPKVPLDVIERLLGKLPEIELRKLVKTGRVRDAVKRLIIARVSGRS